LGRLAAPLPIPPKRAVWPHTPLSGRAPHLARLDGASGSGRAPVPATRPAPWMLTWHLPSGPDHQACGRTTVRPPAGPQRSPEGVPAPPRASGARRTHAPRGGTPTDPRPSRSHERTRPSGKRQHPGRNQPVPKVPRAPVDRNWGGRGRRRLLALPAGAKFPRESQRHARPHPRRRADARCGIRDSGGHRHAVGPSGGRTALGRPPRYA
jgi:hypothetical protein